MGDKVATNPGARGALARWGTPTGTMACRSGVGAGSFVKILPQGVQG